MRTNKTIHEALGFDDVMLVPAESKLKKTDIDLRTRLTRGITLSVPLIACGGVAVESALAVALARLGGIGVIHGQMPLGKQVEEVRRVKRAEGDIVAEPITLSPDSSIAEAMDLMATYRISGLPVIEQPSRKVLGIVTRRDVRFEDDATRPVKDVMTTNVVTAMQKTSREDARRLMREHRIEKLVLVDDKQRCAGLLTVEDMEKSDHHPLAVRDAQGRLRVGATVGLGKEAVDRAAAMTDAGLDVVFIDAPHAHARDVIDTVRTIRQQRSSDVQVVVGNVLSAEAAMSLIDAGADGIKIGGDVDTASAVRRGFGMAQATALMDVAEQCALQGVPAIAGGGIFSAGDLAKALAAGTDCAVIDLFAGALEAAGETVFDDDMRAYKKFGAVKTAALDTSVPCRGPAADIAVALLSGLCDAMVFTGSKDITALHDAKLVRVKV